MTSPLRIVHGVPDWAPGFTAAAAVAILTGLARSYLPYAIDNPLPPLYRSGIRFRPEDGHGSGVDYFDNPWDVAARGHGDCDDLVLYRLVELGLRGERARATAEWWPDGAVHVAVRRANGDIEDPSLILGAKPEVMRQ